MADDRLSNPQYVWNQLDYEHGALIEASAGTGKTYALESIVLKLVQQKEYDATNILLVTFTEKAAGELKDRIRKALEAAGKLPANFDEMTICTIHSFCRQLLTEYAFENGVPMKSEIGGDSNHLAHKAVLEALKDERFAQRYKDTILGVMEESGFKTINELVKYTEGIVENGTCEKKQKSMVKAIESGKTAVVTAVKALKEIHNENFGSYIKGKAKFWGRTPAFYDWLDSSFETLLQPSNGDFLRTVLECPFPDDLNSTIRAWDGCSVMEGRRGAKLFSLRLEYKDPLTAFVEAVARVTEAHKNDQRHTIVFDLAHIAMPRFLELKKEAALLTFDDMVLRAAEVVTRTPQDDGEKLAQLRFFDSIRKRYRVALVDEFQDTDQHQWDIFRTLFSSKEGNSVEGEKPGFLLVVGDPKQAIYSFRGADVKVYCSARDRIDQRKTLGKTYRSKKSLVKAFNIFFRDAPEGGNPDDGNGGTGSDWFKDGAAGDGISYEDVSYPEGNEKFAGLQDPEGTETPVLLLESMPSKIEPSSSSRGIRFGNKASCLPVFMDNAAREMLYLKSLNPAPWTRKEYNKEKNTFSYGDMCVLVATNADAVVARRILAKYGIPYGQYKQQGIYDSPEAEGVLALLDYLAHPSGSGNRTALLLSPIFGIHPSVLSKRSQADDATFDTFIEKLQTLVADKDWNKLFECVMSDPCTTLATPSSDLCAFNRTRAAVRQIFDALLTEVGGLAESVSEFAAILREWRKNDKAAGEDGALFKKESEADRVQIMTMHASKGLQFPIVFIAYGFSKQITKGTPKEDEPAALEERRRLLYVALTRAEYRLYLPWSKRAWKWEGDVRGSGIGSAGSALLVGDNSDQTKGFLGRAIQVYFRGKENSAFAPERQLPGEYVESPGNGLEHTSSPRHPFEEVSIPGLKSRRVHWDSFTYIPQGSTPPVDHGKKDTAEDENPDPNPEPDNPTVETKTLLPRGQVSGNTFHTIMETLCKNDAKDGSVDFTTACNEKLKESDSPLMELIRASMRKESLTNHTGTGDSDAPDTDDSETADTTEKVLFRMVQNVLKTPIKIGETEPFLLKDIPKKDRLAEVEFVIDEQNLLTGLPKDRDGVMNGKIDLLVRIGDKVFVLDWKTNSLPNYEEAAVNEKMDEAGYHLQYKIYSLAASEWLKLRGLTLGGVAYLFVRGGEVGKKSGVFVKAFDEKTLEGFRNEISKMGYFAGKKEDV